MKNSCLPGGVSFVTNTIDARVTGDSGQRLTQNVVVAAADDFLYAICLTTPEASKERPPKTSLSRYALPVSGTCNAAGVFANLLGTAPDFTNKDVVRVEGWPGQVQNPAEKTATYKVPMQKPKVKKAQQRSLFSNPPSKELTLVLDRPFDRAAPASFAPATDKQKVGSTPA